MTTLVDRFIAGDPGAFGELVRRIGPALRRAIAHRIADPSLVDDVVQETLLRAHLARASFRGHGEGDGEAALVGWCLGIARNTAIDGLRREQRHLRGRVDERIALDCCAADDDPEAWVLLAEHRSARRQRLHAAIERLPASGREVVRLHKLEGMAMKDIAARLHLRIGTVRVRAHRAYLALAHAFAG